MKALRSIFPILVLAVVGCGCEQKSQWSNSELCAHNLSLIRGAKDSWRFNSGKTTNDIPTMNDLTNWMGGVAVCPDGGTYTLGPVWQTPTCSIKGHVIAPLKSDY